MTPLLPLAGSVALNAVAQITLRYASSEQGARNRRVWLGAWGATLVVATALWIAAIRSADISWAYPLLGAGYVLVTIMALVFLHERVPPSRWLAILVISVGVVMVGANR